MPAIYLSLFPLASLVSFHLAELHSKSVCSQETIVKGLHLIFND